MNLTFGSLFAGIGGIDLGLERAGMRCLWQVEIDDYCRRVLAKHWPNVERFRDVRECGSHNLRPVDLVVGGFPCQPHSVAGKRRGAKDDRNLWPEFSRIIAELRPRFVLAENVPGIVTTYLDTVLSDLEDQGYTCGTFNLPACAFDAPHRRERIFVIAYRNCLGWETGTVKRVQSKIGQSERQEFEHLCKNIPKVRNVAHADEQGLAQWQGERSNAQSQQSPALGTGGEGRNVAHAPRQLCDGGDDNGRCRPEQTPEFGDGLEEARPLGSGWAIEPRICRVATRVPHRVDRLRGLGNAVVPQVAEWIGHRIMEVAR